MAFRELQVVELVSQAKSNKQIAWELRLELGTIKEYIHRIQNALGDKVAERNRVGLAVWWNAQGRAEYHAS